MTNGNFQKSWLAESQQVLLNFFVILFLVLMTLSTQLQANQSECDIAKENLATAETAIEDTKKEKDDTKQVREDTEIVMKDAYKLMKEKQRLYKAEKNPSERKVAQVIFKEARQAYLTARTIYKKAVAAYRTARLAHIRAEKTHDKANKALRKKGCDIQAPTIPTSLTAEVTERQVTLTWSASTDNVAVLAYEILRDGVMLKRTKSKSYIDNTVNTSTTYSYAVLAVDTAENKSDTAVTEVTTSTLPPVTGETLARSCMGCHGTNGQSSGPSMPSLASMSKTSFIHVMGAYKEGTRHGTMMGRIVKAYSSEDIELMADWFAEQELVLAKEDLNVTLVEAGEKLHEAKCNSCHTGLGTSTANGILAGQHSGYLRNTLSDFVTGKSTDVPSAMVTKLTDLTAQEMESLVAYYASYGFASTKFNAPTDLNIDAQTKSSVTLSWIDPNVERKAVAFDVLRDDVLIATIGATSYTDATLELDTSYYYKVVAIDGDSVRSSASSSVYVDNSEDNDDNGSDDGGDHVVGSADSGEALWEKSSCTTCHSVTESFSNGLTRGTFTVALNSNLGGMGDLYADFSNQDQADIVAYINSQRVASTNLSDIKLLDNTETLRKATLLFAGRLPTTQEYTLSSTDEGLRQAIRASMSGENWDDFVFETGNMHFQTEGLKNSNLIYHKQWLSYAQNHEDFMMSGPVLLLHYIANNDRSYTEMLTADYTVASQTVIERIYGADVVGAYEGFRHRNGQYAPAKKTFKEKPYPHAGVMSMPAWLGKFPTTDSNRNRHRANVIYQQFLGLDIEDLAKRGVDDSGLEKYKAPLMEAPACASCHVVLEPTAGMFQNWFDRTLFRGTPRLDPKYKDGTDFGTNHAGSQWYEAGDNWYRDSFEPGFEDKKMPGGYKGFNKEDANGVIAYAGNNNGATSALQWLAREVIADPRFGSGAAKFWYKGMFGRDYTENQEQLLQEIGRKFTSSGFIVRDLLADIAVSELFRADGFTLAVDEEREQEMAGWGTGRMLSSQQLNKKSKSVLNWNVFEEPTKGRGLFYGGYDEGKLSATINQDMTPSTYSLLESAIMRPLCKDKLINQFTLGRVEPIVDEVAIKDHIKGLILKVWGTNMAVDSTEVERIYGLYTSVYNSSGDHTSECSKSEARDIPSKRAWAAVGAYLLTDIKYVSE